MAQTSSIRNFFIFLIFLLPFFRSIRFATFMTYQDLVLVFCFIYLFFSQSNFLRKNRNFLFSALGILSILILLTSLSSKDEYHNLINATKCFNTFAILPIVIRNLITNREQFCLALRSYIFGSVLSVIVWFLTGYNSVNLNLERSSGFGGDPVLQSVLLTFSLVLLIYSRPFIFAIYWQIFFVTMIILGILKTGSVTPFIMIGISIMVFLISNFFIRRKRIFVRSILFFPYLVFCYLIFRNSVAADRLSTILNPSSSFTLNSSSGQSSLDIRLETLKFSWMRIVENPIVGNGFDNDGQMTAIGYQAHNVLLLGWQSGGMITFFVFLFLLALSLKHALQALKQGEVVRPSILILTWFCLNSEPLFWETAFYSIFFLFLVSQKVSEIKRSHF